MQKQRMLEYGFVIWALMAIIASILVFVQWQKPEAATLEPLGKTSLTNEPFVHPRLVEELVTPVSDGGDQIVSLDIDSSEGSDRFCCDEADGTSYLRVTEGAYDNQYHGFFYRTVGRTDSGVYVIHTGSHDGGSGSWHDLIFVVIENDPGFKVDLEAGTAELTRPRRVMRKLGQTFLGDRWKGQLKIDGNTLYIGKDHGWFSDEPDMGDVQERTNDWENIVKIAYSRP